MMYRFCYFTGSDLPVDRHGSNLAYGSSYHRQTQSDSLPYRRHSLETVPTAYAESKTGNEVPASPGYDASVVINDPSEKHATFASVDSQWSNATIQEGADEDGWSSGSGHTTPTRSPKQAKRSLMMTSIEPQPRSSVPEADVEATPRPADAFVRPHRGSL